MQSLQLMNRWMRNVCFMRYKTGQQNCILGTHLFPGRQDFCIASTVYLKNSWASSWLPNLKCFPIPEDKTKRSVDKAINTLAFRMVRPFLRT